MALQLSDGDALAVDQTKLLLPIASCVQRIDAMINESMLKKVPSTPLRRHRNDTLSPARQQDQMRRAAGRLGCGAVNLNVVRGRTGKPGE
jgi:hypothetical protein